MRTLVVGLTVSLAGCGAMMKSQAHRCLPAVRPIRNTAIVVLLTIDYAYNAVDETEGRTGHKQDVLDTLDELGSGDGNSFAEPNGEQINFYFNYTLYNDGQDHFTGQLELRGWGWGQGHITTVGLWQPYASSDQLIHDLTRQAYGFIQNGWHDNYVGCPTN
jgi:hypothetical protein